ncbi:MAG: hypothetical protein ABF248_01735, partial [Yoonia sp.]
RGKASTVSVDNSVGKTLPVQDFRCFMGPLGYCLKNRQLFNSLLYKEKIIPFYQALENINVL